MVLANSACQRSGSALHRPGFAEWKAHDQEIGAT